MAPLWAQAGRRATRKPRSGARTTARSGGTSWAALSSTRARNAMVGDRTAFGALLRRYRTTAGLTQEALAEQAGLSLRGVSDLERGLRRVPYPETVERLV